MDFVTAADIPDPRPPGRYHAFRNGACIRAGALGARDHFFVDFSAFGFSGCTSIGFITYVRP